MKAINWLFAGIEATLWYCFIFYFLYAVRHETNLYVSAFILLSLVYTASMSCPFIRSTDAWKRMWER